MASEQEARACNSLPEPLGSLVASLNSAAYGGRTCLCYDGVLRSLDSNATVLDAIGLTEQQITHMHTIFPLPKGFDKFRGADGTTIPREEWMHPAKSLVGEPESEEAQAQLRKRNDEHPEEAEARRSRAKHAAEVARRRIRGNPELYGKVAYEKEMQRAVGVEHADVVGRKSI